VHVALRRDDQGVERNHVMRFDVLRVDPPRPEPFAPLAEPGPPVVQPKPRSESQPTPARPRKRSRKS
jgi:hypothetical protein